MPVIVSVWTNDQKELYLLLNKAFGCLHPSIKTIGVWWMTDIQLE